MPVKYRREIDGIRALAVLPVILFHGGFPGFSGGYVGVDVFFVISGYLITSIIRADLAEGRFSILEFYERRARRILPALCFVVFACIPFAWFWMIPDQLHAFAGSLIAVASFSSNFLFWSEAGYFDAPAELKPLLHTWSLAAEEQFYLIYPVLLILIWRGGRTLILLALTGIAVFSLFLAQAGGNLAFTYPFYDEDLLSFNQPRWASFYLLTGRFWELLVGAIAAIRPIGLQADRFVNEVGSLTGLFLVVVAVVTFDSSTPFPSVHTVLPVAGTFLMISFATPQTIVGRALSVGPLVGVGLISYSAYLWHQPLFAFLRIRSIEEPRWWQLLLLSAVALILAYLTWRFVEKPFRNRRWLTRRQVFAYSGLASGAIIAIGGWIFFQDGAIDRYPSDHHELVARYPRAEYVSGRFQKLTDTRIESEQSLLIIGDSFAEDFVNAAFENGYLDNLEVATYYIPFRCGVVATSAGHVDQHIEPLDLPECIKHKRFDSPRLLETLSKVEHVILVANWAGWRVEYLPDTLEYLAARTDADIIVVGSKSFGRPNFSRYLSLRPEERIQHTQEIPDEFIDDNNRAIDLVSELQFVDAHRAFCRDEIRCRAFTPDGHLISHDGYHLTPEGARYYGQILFQDPLLQGFR